MFIRIEKECTQVFYHGKISYPDSAPFFLFSYAATAVFLLLLAFGMYRFQWGEKEITLGVRGIYILACFLAGLVAGKKAKRRRFLWGFCAGALYFLIFLALSFAIRQSLKETASSLLLSFALCAGSGTIGGMFS